MKTAAAAEPKLFRAGTLTYTKPALGMLFVWLLWGDFCYTVMESVSPSLIPIKVNDLHASNFVIGVLLGSVPTAVYTFLNAVISFRSDRFRSRWGRRIPFIAFSLPFIVVGLVALGFFEQIATFLHSHLGGMVASLSPAQMAIYTLVTINILFTCFNTFLTSVFWYLFNDVVPEMLLARFMSLFRLISLGAGAFYNLVVVQNASAHFTLIYLTAAAVYFVGFTLMCWNVKEGEYPPPPKYEDFKGPGGAVWSFFKECHYSPHYWYQWIGNFLGSIGGSAGSVGGLVYTAFSLRYYHQLGIDPTSKWNGIFGFGDIGFLFFSINAMTMVLIPVSGWLADKYHPIRVVKVGNYMGFFLMTPANMMFAFWHPVASAGTFWLVWAINVFIAAPTAALGGIYDPPLLMRLFPRSHYGQFCSVNALWRSLGAIVGGFLAYRFLNYMGALVGEGNAYFFIPVWQFAFSIPCIFLFLGLYRSWEKHGGAAAYVPPLVGIAPAMALTSPLTPPDAPDIVVDARKKSK